MYKPLDYNKVGLNIRNLRRMREMTQEELAEKSGITKWYISKIELGITHPRLETYYNIAEALNVTINDFVYDNFDLPDNLSKEQMDVGNEILNILKKYKIFKK